jgi:hypothetical protein
MVFAGPKAGSLVHEMQRLKAAEPWVALPAARQLSGIASDIRTKHHFALCQSSAIPEPRPTNFPEPRPTNREARPIALQPRRRRGSIPRSAISGHRRTGSAVFRLVVPGSHHALRSWRLKPNSGRWPQ